LNHVAFTSPPLIPRPWPDSVDPFPDIGTRWTRHHATEWRRVCILPSDILAGGIHSGYSATPQEQGKVERADRLYNRLVWVGTHSRLSGVLFQSAQFVSFGSLV
jgi:hypothetical protein